MDVLTPKQRHKCMSKIQAKNTKPEILVRKWLHKNGFRYRLYSKQLPGTPDIVMKKHNLVIFIHGCYWHRHQGCKYATTPKTNSDFWQNKFKQNVERDKINQELLVDAGWRILILWECQIKSGEFINIIRSYLVKDLSKE